jgi:hypothetical protein
MRRVRGTDAEAVQLLRIGVQGQQALATELRAIGLDLRAEALEVSATAKLGTIRAIEARIAHRSWS